MEIRLKNLTNKKYALLGITTLFITMSICSAINENHTQARKQIEIHREMKLVIKSAVKVICSSTDYKETCTASLETVRSPDPRLLIRSAFDLSISQIRSGISKGMLELKGRASGDRRTRDALNTCRELIEDAIEDLQKTREQFRGFRFAKLPDFVEDLRVWLSGAVTYQQTCIDEFQGIDSLGAVVMERVLKRAQQHTSNGLAIVSNLDNILKIFHIPIPFPLLSSARESFKSLGDDLSDTAQLPAGAAKESPAGATDEPQDEPQEERSSTVEKSPQQERPSTAEQSTKEEQPSTAGQSTENPSNVEQSNEDQPSNAEQSTKKQSNVEQSNEDQPSNVEQSTKKQSNVEQSTEEQPATEGQSTEKPSNVEQSTKQEEQPSTEEQSPKQEEQEQSPKQEEKSSGNEESSQEVGRNLKEKKDTFGQKVENMLPHWMTGHSRKLLAARPKTIRANVVVSRNGKVKTITQALAMVPQNNRRRFVIHIKAGVYKEKVEVTKKMLNVMFIGDGPTKTIITGDIAFLPDRIGTFKTATVAVNGDHFIAKDIGFENTAGPARHQAVALRVSADFSVFYNCHMSGYQDTLYVHTHRQFYRNCRISGTIDFVFGDAKAVFQHCDFVIRRPMDHQQCIVTAQGRKDHHETTGIVIQRSRIIGDNTFSPVKAKNKAFLGRPWKQFSRTIIMNTEIDDVIDPEGWLKWNETFALDTLFYSEFRNSGRGSGQNRRVKWKGIQRISDRLARQFTPGKFLRGNKWIPQAHVPYNPN